MNSARILVIDDESDMRVILRDNLEFENYRVLTAVTGEEGLELGLRERPDVVLLDVMLPKMTGYDVCRQFRARGFTSPIIMLTARHADVDRITGLDLGADDYIGKPFSVGEMLARVRVQLRRRHEQSGDPSEVFHFGDVSVDLRRHAVKRNGRRLELSSREFRLLAYFVARRGELMTREEILSDVWGYRHCPPTRTVDNYVMKLRTRLEVDPAHPEFFLTVYGTGYRLAVPRAGAGVRRRQSFDN
ncbi:MAG: response regulator transcription factor [Acidobacteria bacterium]|nr:response regulator transcription factor [Acidobacteriota bacterium]